MSLKSVCIDSGTNNNASGFGQFLVVKFFEVLMNHNRSMGPLLIDKHQSNYAYIT